MRLYHFTRLTALVGDSGMDALMRRLGEEVDLFSVAAPGRSSPPACGPAEPTLRRRSPRPLAVVRLADRRSRHVARVLQHLGRLASLMCHSEPGSSPLPVADLRP